MDKTEHKTGTAKDPIPSFIQWTDQDLMTCEWMLGRKPGSDEPITKWRPDKLNRLAKRYLEVFYQIKPRGELIAILDNEMVAYTPEQLNALIREYMLVEAAQSPLTKEQPEKHLRQIAEESPEVMSIIAEAKEARQMANNCEKRIELQRKQIEEIEMRRYEAERQLKDMAKAKDQLHTEMSKLEAEKSQLKIKLAEANEINRRMQDLKPVLNDPTYNSHRTGGTPDQVAALFFKQRYEDQRRQYRDLWKKHQELQDQIDMLQDPTAIADQNNES